ncbi:MAG TPA: type II methionyl aminopeptidase [Candidatus Nanoarchaeia archaeon]|nr:type II methionyl aminopeptidase [Candidatus Nanoarchaeia archaeon]
MYHELGKSEEDSEIADDDMIQKLKKSGNIAAEALDFGKNIIKKGAKPLDILDAVEEFILKNGAHCAFPPQLSVNDTAAHSCPDVGDASVLGDDVVKLDVGVHIDGYLSDNAITVDLSGKWKELLKANSEALQAALKMAVPGTQTGAIGKTIQEIISSYGYSPVRNLSGHGLGRYKVHTRPSIPNVDTGSATLLRAGMVIAIEPFATNGAGVIYESGEAGVFMLAKKKPIRDPISRSVLQFIETYNGLPFARKWLTRQFGVGKTNFALRNLAQQDILRAYPPLVDEQHGVVSQMEKTVLVAEKPVILTQS